METRETGRLIERLAGLSLPALECTIPRLVAAGNGDEWQKELRALRATLDGKPEVFWADALIRAAEGDVGYLGSRSFRAEYADAQNKRAGVQFKAGGREALAAQAFLRAALAYKVAGNSEAWRKALKNRASVLAILGHGRGSLAHLNEAVRSYEQCLAAADPHSERRIWAELQADLVYALQGIGLINNDRAAYERSAAAYEAAANMLAETGAEGALWSRAKNSLGATMALLGELESDPAAIVKAISAYREALRGRPVESTPGLWLGTSTNIVHAEQVLANITGDLGRLRRAHEELVGKINSLDQTRLNPGQRAQFYGQLGTNAQLLGEKDRRPSDLRAALRFYDEAQAGIANPFLVARLRAHRAMADFRLGELTGDAAVMREALENYEELHALFPRKERPQLWAYWQQSRGKMRARLARAGSGPGCGREARQAFEAALTEYRREIYPQQWAETQASLCRTLGWMAGSQADWQELAALADDLIEGVHVLALAGASRPKQRALLRALQGMGDLAAAAHVRLGAPEAAFSVLALARAVGSELAFRLAGGRSAAPGDQDRDVFAQWQKLQAAADRQLRAALDTAAKAGPVSTAELDDLRAAYTAVRGTLKRRGALERDSLDAQAFAARLEEGSVAAVMFVSERGGGIIVITRGIDAIPAECVIDLPELTRSRVDALLHGEGGRSGWLGAYERYRKETSADDEAAIERAVIAWNGAIEEVLPDLWDLAMGPLAQWLDAHAEGAREVALLAPGLLSMVPLHAARAREDGAAYFCERWAVSYLPGPRPVMVERTTTIPAAARLLAVTDPLGDIGAEVNPAWPFFAEERRRAVQGSAGAVAEALENAGGATHVSFFCHGLWEASDPDLSHLVMADGSQLSAGQLAGIDMRSVDLAVLGACETALIGTRGTPDEFTGLPLALLQSGVGSVAASQWLVDAGSTYALLHYFMREHRSGVSPARALQASQRAFIAGQIETRADLPGVAAMLSRLRTLRPLAVPGAGPDRAAPDENDGRVLPARSAPFFWAAFAVIGKG